VHFLGPRVAKVGPDSLHNAHRSSTSLQRKGVTVINKVCPHNLDLLDGAILLVCLDHAQLLDDLHATLDPSKDGMLAVQPRCRRKRYEELRAVRIGAGVGHAENARAAVLEVRRDLVFELVAVDGIAASPRARRIPALDHEVGNDAVEYEVVEVVALGERREVLARLWRVVVVEFYHDGTLIVLVQAPTAHGGEHAMVVSRATSVVILNVRMCVCEDCMAASP
jgi:hypothetical protein